MSYGSVNFTEGHSHDTLKILPKGLISQKGPHCTHYTRNITDKNILIITSRCDVQLEKMFRASDVHS